MSFHNILRDLFAQICVVAHGADGTKSWTATHLCSETLEHLADNVVLGRKTPSANSIVNDLLKVFR